MKNVFADTWHWVAIQGLDPVESRRAFAALRAAGDCRLVTSESVLTEFLNYMSGRGRGFRKNAVALVRRILPDSRVLVVDQRKEAFAEALDLYESRADKSYSMTDCLSMRLMRRMNIHDVLTDDHHFEQEGFRVLTRKG